MMAGWRARCARSVIVVLQRPYGGVYEALGAWHLWFGASKSCEI